MTDLTTTYVKAEDVQPGDQIDVGELNGCLPHEATRRVMGTSASHGFVRFYANRDGSRNPELFQYARPGAMIPVVTEAK